MIFPQPREAQTKVQSVLRISLVMFITVLSSYKMLKQIITPDPKLKPNLGIAILMIAWLFVLIVSIHYIYDLDPLNLNVS